MWQWHVVLGPPPPGREDRPSSDGGFTLIELMVVMAIAGVLAVTGTFSFTNWRNTSQHQGSAEQLVSHLRNASERAISEGRTYCVEVLPGGKAYDTYRYSCSTTAPAQKVATSKVQGSNVSFAVTMTPPVVATTCPTTSKCLYFYPRGTAQPASVLVSSTARTKTYTVRVEGLTARVYL